MRFGGRMLAWHPVEVRGWLGMSEEAEGGTEVLTLERVAAQPELVTSHLALADGTEVVFRPLQREDVEALGAFLAGLSAQTRSYYCYPSYDLTMAREMCEAIGRYDKLRMVAVVEARIVGIFEFCLSILPADVARFRGYGMDLDCQTDIRFGACLADNWQNRGLGSRLLPRMREIALRFEKRRMILWGGVFAENARAIRYYVKNGFRRCGRFRDADGRECWDAFLCWE